MNHLTLTWGYATPIPTVFRPQGWNIPLLPPLRRHEPRPCISCGAPIPSGIRCPRCASRRNRARDAIRGNFRQRGYTGAFDKARARLAPAAVGRPCPLCGEPMRAGFIDVDHIVPLGSGGTNDPSNLRAVCARCNRGRR